MAVPRYTSKSSVPVKQAQMAPAYSFNYAEAEAVGDIGKVFTALAFRKRAADDALAVAAAKDARDLTARQMSLFMQENPDPDKWEPHLQKLITQNRKAFSQQKFSQQVKKQQDLDQRAFEEQIRLNVKIANTQQSVDNAIVETGRRMILSIESGADASEEKQAYKEALLRKHSPEVAKVYYEESMLEGRKAYYTNQAILFPKKTLKAAQKKQKRLAKGKADKEGLTAKDWEQIADTARGISSQRERGRKANLEALQEQNDRALLADFLEGKEISPDEFHEKIRNKEVSVSFAKYLKEELEKDEDTEYDVQAHSEALKVIDRYASGALEEKPAYNQLWEIMPRLDKATQKTMIESFYKAPDSGVATMRTAAIGKMRSIILDKNPLTGMLQGNSEQQKADAQAYLMLHGEMKEAAQKGSPLTGEQVYTRAVEIALMLRSELEESGKIRGVVMKVDTTFPSISVDKPSTKDDFLDTVKRLNAEDPKKAKAYYDKHIGSFEW